jgi:hypothetical protein
MNEPGPREADAHPVYHQYQTRYVEGWLGGKTHVLA